MRSRVVSVFCLVVGLAGVVVACSSDDDPAGGPATGTTASTHVSAAAGGTVKDPSGKVTLTIPPGALAADTDISVGVEAASNGSASAVYAFGPDGLQFSKPVVLELDAAGIAVPEGKSLSVALLEGTTFTPLPGSTFAGTKASASIMHFSRYSLVVIDGKIVITPPAGCEDAYAKFAPCGGDLTGTWTFTDFCIDVGTPPGDGTTTCAGITATGDIDIDREATFSGGTISLSAGSLKLTSTINYPRSCYDNVDCAALQKSVYTDKGKTDTCAAMGADVCSCTGTAQDAPQEAETQTYTTSGTSITITKADGTMSTTEYCVTGDIAVSRAADANGKRGGLFVLKRK